MKQQKLNSQLIKLLEDANVRLSKLEGQISEASDVTKQQVKLASRQINEERQKIVEKIEEVTNASENDWQMLKTETNSFLRDKGRKINKLIQAVESQLKQD